MVGLVIQLLTHSLGEGIVLLLTEFDTPPQPGVAALMNFTEKVKSTLLHMTWAGVNEDYVPGTSPAHPCEVA